MLPWDSCYWRNSHLFPIFAYSQHCCLHSRVTGLLTLLVKFELNEENWRSKRSKWQPCAGCGHVVQASMCDRAIMGAGQCNWWRRTRVTVETIAIGPKLQRLAQESDCWQSITNRLQLTWRSKLGCCCSCNQRVWIALYPSRYQDRLDPWRGYYVPEKIKCSVLVACTIRWKQKGLAWLRCGSRLHSFQITRVTNQGPWDWHPPNAIDFSLACVSLLLLAPIRVKYILIIVLCKQLRPIYSV